MGNLSENRLYFRSLLFFWISFATWSLLMDSYLSIPVALAGTFVLWRIKLSDRAILVLGGVGVAFACESGLFLVVFLLAALSPSFFAFMAHQLQSQTPNQMAGLIAGAIAGELRWRATRSTGKGESTEYQLNAFTFAGLALFLWLPTMFVLDFVLRHWPGTGSIQGKLSALTSGFAFLYLLTSAPFVALLWWIRPRSRLVSIAISLACGVVVSLLALMLSLLLAFIHWAFIGLGIAFTVYTGSLGPIVWAVLVGELRWRAQKANSGRSLQLAEAVGEQEIGKRT
ncbi:MAG TPA: hypothetical protein VEW69_08940 [Alphaproteobacteria bacterium]|nr:hypothetical protein [Alphaproteobacteria bacterium]